MFELLSHRFLALRRCVALRRFFLRYAIVTPDAITYSALINACARGNNAEKALQPFGGNASERPGAQCDHIQCSHQWLRKGVMQQQLFARRASSSNYRGVLASCLHADQADRTTDEFWLAVCEQSEQLELPPCKQFARGASISSWWSTATARTAEAFIYDAACAQTEQLELPMSSCKLNPRRARSSY